MYRLLFRSLVLFALVTSAQAANVPPVSNWTGFYIGANVGGGWGNQSVNYTPNDPSSAELFVAANGGGPPATSFSTSGALGGLQAGYNWQTAPNWLVGVETDFDWSAIKGSGSSSYLVFPTSLVLPAASPVDEQTTWFGTVRGRWGYLPTQNLLAYLTGGFAYGRIQHNGSYVNNSTTEFGVGTGAQCNPGGAPCYVGSSATTAVGWTAGAGLEYAVSQRLSIKAEYLYVSLGSTPLTETALSLPFLIGTPPFSTLNANFDRTNFNVVRVGSNFRF